MAFQAARLPARIDDEGNMVLLEEQDRSKWDQQLVTFAFRELESSAEGDEISSYHMQAAIASVHAHADTGESTNWSAILSLYEDLLHATPSPVVALNRSVAVAKVHGAAQALADIKHLSTDPLLGGYYLLPAVRGRLLQELGEHQAAADSYQRALQCPCSEPERKFLRRKLAECQSSTS
jgi:RNA polymerase sigma-70 factor (ECF subfamily)